MRRIQRHSAGERAVEHDVFRRVADGGKALAAGCGDGDMVVVLAGLDRHHVRRGHVRHRIGEAAAAVVDTGRGDVLFAVFHGHHHLGGIVGGVKRQGEGVAVAVEHVACRRAGDRHALGGRGIEGHGIAVLHGVRNGNRHVAGNGRHLIGDRSAVLDAGGDRRVFGGCCGNGGITVGVFQRQDDGEAAVVDRAVRGCHGVTDALNHGDEVRVCAPLRIQGDHFAGRRAEVIHKLAVRKCPAGTVGRGIPPGEGVAGAREGIRRQVCGRALDHGKISHRAGTVVGVKADGVVVVPVGGVAAVAHAALRDGDRGHVVALDPGAVPALEGIIGAYGIDKRKVGRFDVVSYGVRSALGQSAAGVIIGNGVAVGDPLRRDLGVARRRVGRVHRRAVVVVEQGLGPRQCPAAEVVAGTYRHRGVGKRRVKRHVAHAGIRDAVVIVEGDGVGVRHRVRGQGHVALRHLKDVVLGGNAVEQVRGHGVPGVPGVAGLHHRVGGDRIAEVDVLGQGLPHRAVDGVEHDAGDARAGHDRQRLLCALIVNADQRASVGVHVHRVRRIHTDEVVAVPVLRILEGKAALFFLIRLDPCKIHVGVCALLQVGGHVQILRVAQAIGVHIEVLNGVRDRQTRPLRVQGNGGVVVGGQVLDVVAVAVRRAGAVGGGVPAGELITGARIGVRAELFEHVVDKAGLRRHFAAVAAVDIIGHGIGVRRPLGVEGHDPAVLGGQVRYRLTVSVIRARSVCQRVPPVGRVAGAGQVVRRQSAVLAVGSGCIRRRRAGRIVVAFIMDRVGVRLGTRRHAQACRRHIEGIRLVRRRAGNQRRFARGPLREVVSGVRHHIHGHGGVVIHLRRCAGHCVHVGAREHFQLVLISAVIQLDDAGTVGQDRGGHARTLGVVGKAGISLLLIGVDDRIVRGAGEAFGFRRVAQIHAGRRHLIMLDRVDGVVTRRPLRLQLDSAVLTGQRRAGGIGLGRGPAARV